jgi:hypothetical protein
MTDETLAMGGNAREELKRRIERRIAIIDRIAELQPRRKSDDGKIVPFGGKKPN